MERLESLRRRKLMSRGALAREVGVTEGTIKFWEVGRTFPQLKQVRALLRVLEISLEELLTPEEIQRHIDTRRLDEMKD